MKKIIWFTLVAMIFIGCGDITGSNIEDPNHNDDIDTIVEVEIIDTIITYDTITHITRDLYTFDIRVIPNYSITYSGLDSPIIYDTVGLDIRSITVAFEMGRTDSIDTPYEDNNITFLHTDIKYSSKVNNILKLFIQSYAVSEDDWYNPTRFGFNNTITWDRSGANETLVGMVDSVDVEPLVFSNNHEFRVGDIRAFYINFDIVMTFREYTVEYEYLVDTSFVIY